MVSIAGSKKLKRQMAPLFWGIERKKKRFVVTVRPGPHPKRNSIPIAVFLRDTLKIVRTLKEAKKSIYSGQITIDGVVRKSLHHGIGLMDTIQLSSVNSVYRLLPIDGRLLKPIEIDAAEKTKKICKVTSKKSIRGNRTQLGFHDGRSLITDEDVSVGDSCLMQVPEQRIIEVIRLEKGVQAMIIRGINAGRVGTIINIKQGTFVLPRMATITLGKREIEIPTEMLMVVGRESPIIQIR